MRIVSFLPSATAILLALDAGGDIVGISHENRDIAAVAHLPLVSTLKCDDANLSAAQIDALVSATQARGESLYRVDAERLRALRPDLVITQNLCNVCAVTPNDFQKAMAGLEPAPAILSLNAHTLAEAKDDIRRVAGAIGKPAAAEEVLEGWEARLWAIERRLPGDAARPRVACLEWPDPPYNCGHWVPEMVELAGGREVLGSPGEYSSRIEWSALAAVEPEVVVMMFCGLPLERARAEAAALVARGAFQGLPADEAGRIWVVDGPAYFSQSGPGLMRGIELLAQIFHPDLFGAPDTAAAATVPAA